MKKKLNHHLLMLTFLAIMATGCHESPIGDSFADDQYVSMGALVSASNVQTGFFDLGDPDNASIAFDLSASGESVSTTDIQVSYNGGDPVSFRPGVSVPGTATVTLNEVLAATGLSIDDVAVGDEFRFLFDSTSPSGTFRSSNTLVAAISCKSELAGTYDFSTVSSGSAPWTTGVTTTGKIRFDDQGSGIYDIYTTPAGGVEFLDISMGAYFGGWGYDPTDPSTQGSLPNTGTTAGRVQIRDICNELSYIGASQWDESYVFNSIEVNGSVLTLNWSNSYGEGGVATITRTDGTDWPPLHN